MGTSPLSPSSLESSWTWKNLQIYRNNRFSFHFVFSHVIPLSRLRSALTSCNFCVSTPILKLEMTLFMICIANQMRQVSVQLNSRVRPWTSKCPTSSPWIDDLKALYDHESILTWKLLMTIIGVVPFQHFCYRCRAQKELVSERPLGIIGRSKSHVCSKSNWFTCCDLLGFLHEFEVYSTDSSRIIGNFLKSWTSTSTFKNSTSSFVSSGQFSPFMERSSKMHKIITCIWDLGDWHVSPDTCSMSLENLQI